ncbi:uncharacterized protein LOC141672217 isoform X2 [Apium graveolens]|uniref:uncharacterized protein LOC141672217 isoform X2 n=1 Tax=Apium graveolens TaxID=4045 RepID=UPI003D7A1C3A
MKVKLFYLPSTCFPPFLKLGSKGLSITDAPVLVPFVQGLISAESNIPKQGLRSAESSIPKQGLRSAESSIPKQGLRSAESSMAPRKFGIIGLPSPFSPSLFYHLAGRLYCRLPDRMFDSLEMEEPEEKKFRIVMSSSRCLKTLNEVTAEIIRVAKGKGLRVWGPSRAPNRLVDSNTRLASCSEGSSTCDNIKLCVYETTVDVLSSTEVVEEIVSGCEVADVKIEIKVVNLGGRRP